MKDRSGWQALLEWSVVSGLATLSLLGMASIGMLIVPIAVGAGVIVARRNRAWPESFFGAVFGVAVICLVVAAGNFNYAPCPEGPVTMMPGEGPIHCGGHDPMPWLTVGCGLAVLALGGYAILRGTQRRATA